MSGSFLKIAIFSLLMVVCASATNAVMDVLSFRYQRSVFSRMESRQGWLDPKISWKNKWKNGDPAEGEAFPLSSTALVGVTDAWHFFKTLCIWSLLLAVIVPFTHFIKFHWAIWCGVFIGLDILHGLVFELIFNHL